MAKIWQVYPAAPADFLEDTQYAPIARQLLYNRGLKTKEQAQEFLNPDLATALHDPFLFRDMKASVDLIIDHIKKGNKIAVCGDYDADGVSSSAIMTEVISTLKGKVEVWIPSRFGQGYGLNKDIVNELKESGFSLIITVDNGIRSKAEVEFAQAIGLEVIVTDHHEGPPEDADYPACLIINPILEKETYPFKYLCGAGVAFKLASALISRATISDEDKQKLSERLSALAAIGTIADCVTLLGENRLLVKLGLEMLNRKPRIGVRALMEVAGISLGEVNEWNVSWQITPRLNVAGRLDHANAAYQLLITGDATEAKKIAEDLNAKNIERQGMTAAIVEEAAAEIAKNQLGEKLLVAVSPNVLDESKQGWNEGVIGLSAGRLAERFSRPCLVITRSEGKIKGSGRSVEQFNLVSALEAGKEHLDRYGGHKMACGFSVKSLEDLEPFIEKARALARADLAGVNLSPILKIDAAVSTSEITEDFIETVERFMPYGQDNALPLFSSRATIDEIMVMGKEKTHVKFRLGRLWALGFNRAAEWQSFKAGDTIDFVFSVSFNIFNGRKDPQLKIVDLHAAQ
jgi:single-stranded-DNA-specific exonuclease